jgi:hypothetical protein
MMMQSIKRIIFMRTKKNLLMNIFFIASMKNFIAIILMFLASVQINTAFSQETITVKEVYTSPEIEEGDTLWVVGYYTNPDYNILLEFYGHWDRDEVFDPQSFLILTGLQPLTHSWNGGYIVAKGTVSFTTVTEPLHPVDTVLATIEVFDIDVLMNGEGELINGEDGLPGIDKFNNLNDNPQLPKSECDSCKFAVLISGGVNAHNNHSKYWENLVSLFKFKVDSLNYCEQNIYVHYYHGTRLDSRIPQNRVRTADSASIKNSHAEIAARVAACTQSGKSATFQKMVTNHGKADGTIHLLNHKTLSNSVLKSWQQPIIDSCCSVVKDEFLQCYGGYTVDEMMDLDTRNKATIYINSNADKETGYSPHGETHHYLRAKIDALADGKTYENAVVEGKLAYDIYLQDRINRAHEYAQYFRNNPTVTNAAEQLGQWVADSTDRSVKICKSRNVIVSPMKEYCEWKRFVVPPEGQLVVDFKGDKKNCGNVTVYHEDPSTGEVTKKKVWNWNLPNSLLYLTGNNRRVINGDADTATAFWVHNDNGQYTISVSAKGNQDLAESGSNQIEYPGFSFGGRDESSGEFFTYENINGIDIYNIDLLPLPLNILPAYMGVSYLKNLAFTFSIIPTDILWTEMALTLFVNEVISPGQFWVYTENSEQEFTQIEITEPGTYNIPFGDMTISGTGGYILMGFPYDYGGAVFSMDAWGLRTTMNVNPELQNVTVIDGEDVCFGTPGYISTGGNGSVFYVMDGAKVKLVAGQGITLLDGTLIEQGADFIAYITTDGIYCDPSPEVLANINEPDKNEYYLEINENQSGFFRVYPNPTKGQFTLEFTEIRDFSIAYVGIFNLFGENIKGTQVVALGRHLFDLSDKPPGVYLIRVTKGDNVGVEKVIKH